MNYRLFFIITIALIACKSFNKKQGLPPDIFIQTSDTALKNNNGTWMYNSLPLSGYIIEKSNEKLLAKLPVINGKESGIAMAWFANGNKKYERNYLNGNREGIHKGWYENGVLAFVYYFHNDKYEGEQLSYFESGHLWQSLHYINGYEEGKQKSYNDSGRVVNNFTVKKGKLYGVIGRYDCMSVYKK